MRKATIYILSIMFVFLLAGCGEEMNQTEIDVSSLVFALMGRNKGKPSAKYETAFLSAYCLRGE